MTKTTLMAAAAAIVALGCQRDAQQDAAKDTTGATTATASPSTTVATFDGVGRARIGATVAQLREAGSVPDAAPGAAACRIVRLDWMPPGTRAMFAHDTLVRIEVDSTATTRTVEGAAIGDAESRIHELYPRVETQPEKYVATNHNLIVASPNDTLRRMIFTTDGKTVRGYRIGRRPAVDFVEGCG